MGTHSVTYIHEDDDPNPLVAIYQQYDGYLDGVGQTIIDFLSDTVVVNGIPGGRDDTEIFNGAGDLAARLITHFKGGDANNAGAVYIVPADHLWKNEYTYHIYCTVGEAPCLIAYEGDTIIYDSGRDPDAPMTDEQRKALFALFTESFGFINDEARHEFTAAVLGSDAPTSWSRNGGLTAGQAERLIDTLKFVEKS